MYRHTTRPYVTHASTSVCPVRQVAQLIRRICRADKACAVKLITVLLGKPAASDVLASAMSHVTWHGSDSRSRAAGHCDELGRENVRIVCDGQALPAISKCASSIF